MFLVVLQPGNVNDEPKSSAMDKGDKKGTTCSMVWIDVVAHLLLDACQVLLEVIGGLPWEVSALGSVSRLRLQ